MSNILWSHQHIIRLQPYVIDILSTTCRYLQLLQYYTFLRLPSAPSRKASSSCCKSRHMTSVTIIFARCVLTPGMSKHCCRVLIPIGRFSIWSAACMIDVRKHCSFSLANFRRRQASLMFSSHLASDTGAGAQATWCRLAGVTLSAPIKYSRSRLDDDACRKPISNKMLTIVDPTRGTSRASLSVVNGVGWFSILFAAMKSPYRVLLPSGNSCARWRRLFAMSLLRVPISYCCLDLLIRRKYNFLGLIANSCGTARRSVLSWPHIRIYKYSKKCLNSLFSARSSDTTLQISDRLLNIFN